jgi:hypothetical protein
MKNENAFILNFQFYILNFSVRSATPRAIPRLRSRRLHTKPPALWAATSARTLPVRRRWVLQLR